MLKTVYKFLELMKAQRRKLYLSFLFNFLDGIFIMIPNSEQGDRHPWNQ